MKKLFQQVFVTTVTLTVLSYGVAIALACQKDPNPQQIQIINSLVTNGENGTKTIFGLLGIDFIRALLPSTQNEDV